MGQSSETVHQPVTLQGTITVPRTCFCLLLLAALPVQGNPDIASTAQEALDWMLNEEYARAHALFDSLITAYPERPEGYLGRAMAYWDASLILEDETQYDREIHRLIKQAIRVSEDRIKAHGESAEMFFWLGSAYGLRAGLGMVRGSIFEGAVDGLRSEEFLSATLALDSTLVDAHFGLGLSDYVIARKPRLLRMVNRFFSLPPGDRKGGLARLDRVAREGTYCRRHALSSRALIELYYEKDAGEARRRFGDLIRRYPNSINYRVRYLDALFALTVKGKQDNRQTLIDSVQSIRNLAQQRGWKLDRWTHTKLTFIEGLGCYLTGQTDRAEEHMEAYVQQAEKKSWLLGPAELILGKLADLRGHRQRAIVHYKRALKQEDVWGTHARAGRYLKRPFSGQEPVQRPPDLVRRYPERP